VHNREVATLGEILSLLHDAAEKARPARLTAVEWRHGPRSSAAFDRFMRERHGTGHGAMQQVVSSGGDEPPPDETSWTTTLALESDTRFREEAAGVQAGKRYVVRDGGRWVSWDADWGAVTSESAEEQGAPSPTHGFLLDPVGAVAAFRLDPTGETRLAGRRAWLVDATPRQEADGSGTALFRLGPGADVVELAVDAEHGALLRSVASIDGEPFHRLEVTEIAFGPIPAATFELSLPPGSEAAGGWLRPQRLPLHELAGAAPFPVLAPDRLPDGWRLTTSLFTAGREHPPVGPQVFLHYASRDGAYAVSIEERAAGTRARDWLAWHRDGELEVADAGEHVEPRHHVRLERAGTVVELSGADASLLAELARALVPAPTAPPRLT
jgi:hypothetical protein